MKLSKVFRHIILLLLVILLAIFTFLSIQKIYTEETVTSFYHVEDGASLPSVTICIKWFHTSVPNTFEYLDWNWSLSKSGDWNFEEYMKKSFDIQSIILNVTVSDQGLDKEHL